MSSQPTENAEVTADTESPAASAADIAGSARWLAALLGIETLPSGYTVAIFHNDGGGAPIEHFTLDNRPLDDNAELLLATIQYTAIHHQVAHFAGKATDEEWAAGIARLTELGDFDEELTIAEMQAGRERIQAAKTGGGPLAALLASAETGGPQVMVIRGPEDMAALRAQLASLLGEEDEPEDEQAGIRSEAISHL